jgi:hypothetical protein
MSLDHSPNWAIPPTLVIVQPGENESALGTSYSTDLYLPESTGESSRVPRRLNSLHRGERYIHHMGTFTPHRGTHRFISNDTPISWESSPHTRAYTSTHPSHGHSHPTQEHTTSHLSLREERHTHLMGTPNSWALSDVVSLSLRVEHVLEDVSRSCNHQHSLLAREAFSTRPSLSRKYTNFVLASGLVKISAICSCVARYFMCTAFLCTMSDIMIFYLNVFRSIVKHRVLRELHTALVITMNNGRIHLMIK